MSKTNAIVGQSGGPTAAINATLAGVIRGALSSKDDIGTLYGMTNGIKGFLREDMINLSEIFADEYNIKLLCQTPSAYLGSCRFKLTKDDDIKRIFEIFEKYNIGYFFYKGGNDSMDTVMKLSNSPYNNGVKIIGVPKTIDNDLAVTDHCPGFGSSAKYIATVVTEVARDTCCYDIPSVTILEIMGRNAGWLTASSTLARSEDCEGVDMICLPEIPFSMENFLKKVEKSQKEKPSTIIAVSEGLKLSDGRYVCDLTNDARFVDSFGHKNLTGTARLLTNYVASNLGGKVRPIELSTLQRCAGHLTSRTDITEAYQVGGAAVKASFEGQSGVMIAIKRISNDPYQSTTEPHDIHEVANFEKKIPIEWINESHTNVLPPYHQYVRPLIQAELTPIFINGLTRHIKL